METKTVGNEEEGIHEYGVGEAKLVVKNEEKSARALIDIEMEASDEDDVEEYVEEIQSLLGTEWEVVDEDEWGDVD